MSRAPKDLRIEVQFARSKETTALLLADAVEDPKALLSPSDPKRDPRAFTLSLARRLETKRGRGERSFVLETRRQVAGFYGNLVENLRDWQAKAPKLAPEETPDDPRVKISSQGAGSSETTQEVTVDAADRPSFAISETGQTAPTPAEATHRPWQLPSAADRR